MQLVDNDSDFSNDDISSMHSDAFQFGANSNRRSYALSAVSAPDSDSSSELVEAKSDLDEDLKAMVGCSSTVQVQGAKLDAETQTMAVKVILICDLLEKSAQTDTPFELPG